jgi:hypothetical protein
MPEIATTLRRLAGAALLGLAVAVGSPAQAIVVKLTPIFIPPLPLPIPLPPLPLPLIKLDLELRARQLFQPFPLPPVPIPPFGPLFCDAAGCFLTGLNLTLSPAVSPVPDLTFFDIDPAAGFEVGATDNTTFLNLVAPVPIPLDRDTEIEVLTSFSTNNIHPFALDQLLFEAFGPFGSETGSVEPLSMPEPASIGILAGGLAVAALRRRRRRERR